VTDHSESIAIEVPLEEADEVAADFRHSMSEVEVFGSKAFDGDAVAQIVLGLSAGTVTIVRTWLMARVARGRSFSVVWKGRHLIGYNADDVVKIIDAIERGDVSQLPAAKSGEDFGKSDELND
jgi:hypothetical protein